MAKPKRPRSETPDEPERFISTTVLRDAVRGAVERGSMRQVAAEIGVSPTSLGSFVSGQRRPRGETLRLVRAWYTGPATERVDDETAQAALRLLLGHLPDNVQALATSEMIDIVRAAYARASLDPPAWIESVEREKEE